VSLRKSKPHPLLVRSSTVNVFIYSHEDRNRTGFRNVVFSIYRQFRIMEKVQKSNDSECVLHGQNPSGLLFTPLDTLTSGSLVVGQVLLVSRKLYVN
jgi:hypothetical protein